MMKALFYYEDETVIMGNLFYNDGGFGVQLFDWKDDKFVTVDNVELELIKFYIPLD